MKKKFYPVFFVIPLLAAAALFAGWTQIWVPLGSVAVLRSKTHGVHEILIKPGNFNWVWYKLIPGNTDLEVFNLKNYSFRIEEAGTLPQADTYSALTGLKSNFSWAISGSFDWTLKEDSLPRLVQRYDIKTQGGLEEWSAGTTRDLENYIKQRLGNYLSSGDNYKLRAAFEELSQSGMIKTLESDIALFFPNIEIVSGAISVKNAPDFQLYEASYALYQDYLDTQKRILQGEVENQAAKYLSSEFKLNELKKYGEVLSKYPILIEYLTLEKKGAE